MSQRVIGRSGIAVTVPDSAARALIRGGYARAVAGGENAGTVETAPRAAVDTPPTPEPEPDPAEPQAEPARPARVAPKSDWIDWAVSCGMVRTSAEAMTKAELVEQFGR